MKALEPFTLGMMYMCEDSRWLKDSMVFKPYILSISVSA